MVLFENLGLHLIGTLPGLPSPTFEGRVEPAWPIRPRPPVDLAWRLQYQQWLPVASNVFHNASDHETYRILVWIHALPSQATSPTDQLKAKVFFCEWHSHEPYS